LNDTRLFRCFRDDNAGVLAAAVSADKLLDKGDAGVLLSSSGNVGCVDEGRDAGEACAVLAVSCIY